MCGVFKQKAEPISFSQLYQPKFTKLALHQVNVAVGAMAQIITNKQGATAQARFGFTKVATAGTKYLFNVRLEGAFNKDNEANYHGELGILKNPWAKTLLSHKRVIVPVTGFLEGPQVERLKMPHEISMLAFETFALAGLIDEDAKTGELGVCLLTTWPQQQIKKVVGHNRCPLILTPDLAHLWMDENCQIGKILPELKPLPGEPFYIEKKYKDKPKQGQLFN